MPPYVCTTCSDINVIKIRNDPFHILIKPPQSSLEIKSYQNSPLPRNPMITSTEPTTVKKVEATILNSGPEDCRKRKWDLFCQGHISESVLSKKLKSQHLDQPTREGKIDVREPRSSQNEGIYSIRYTRPILKHFARHIHNKKSNKHNNKN
jgi:hypothetical protein